MIAALLFLTASLRAADEPRQWGDWVDWGDQGDGTYRNPVIPSDYSDIDCIRVRADYLREFDLSAVCGPLRSVYFRN